MLVQRWHLIFLGLLVIDPPEKLSRVTMVTGLSGQEGSISSAHDWRLRGDRIVRLKGDEVF